MADLKSSSTALSFTSRRCVQPAAPHLALEFLDANNYKTLKVTEIDQSSQEAFECSFQFSGPEKPCQSAHRPACHYQGYCYRQDCKTVISFDLQSPRHWIFGTCQGFSWLSASKGIPRESEWWRRSPLSWNQGRLHPHIKSIRKSLRGRR